MTRRAYTSTRRDQTSSITERVTARDVLSLAGFAEPNRNDMMRCPVHAEKTASFHVLERGFRCFGCGAHGGLFALCIVLDIARDHSSAARWLEENIGHE